MTLTTREKKRFRAIGHHIKPVVTVAGNGLSDNVIAEIERALTDHELIKIKVVAEDRGERQQLSAAICEKCNAVLIQAVGNIILVFRPAEKPNPHLSNLHRIEVF